MAYCILTDQSKASYSKQDVWNNLNETITKVSAMMEIVLCRDFWSLGQDTQYNYFWVLSELIIRSQKLCEQLEIQ